MTTQEKIAKMNKDGHKAILDINSGKIVVGLKSFDSINQAYNHLYKKK